MSLFLSTKIGIVRDRHCILLGIHQTRVAEKRVEAVVRSYHNLVACYLSAIAVQLSDSDDLLTGIEVDRILQMRSSELVVEDSLGDSALLGRQLPERKTLWERKKMMSFSGYE